MEKVIDTIITAIEKLQAASITKKAKANVLLLVCIVVVLAVLAAIRAYLTIDSFAYDRARSTVMNELSTPEGTIGKLKEKLELAEEQVKSENAATAAANAQIAQKDREFLDLLRERTQALTEELASINSTLQETKTTSNTLTAERDELTRRIDVLVQNLKSAEAQREALKSNLAAAEKRVKLLEAEVDRLVSQPVPVEGLATNADTILGVALLPVAKCIAVNTPFEITQNTSVENCGSNALIVFDRHWASGKPDSMGIMINGRQVRIDLGQYEWISDTCRIHYTKFIAAEPVARAEMQFRCN